jgi:hypothetical protein
LLPRFVFFGHFISPNQIDEFQRLSVFIVRQQRAFCNRRNH